MQYQAIIFDLDGTLIDSMQLWRQVDVEFLSKRGIAVPDDLFDCIPGGNSFIQTAQYFKVRFALKESIQEIMDEWTSQVEDHYAKHVKLKAGAFQLLNKLSASGIKIGLGTSNSLHLARIVLQANQVLKLFDGLATGDMQLKGKPFADIYLHCAKLLKVEPELCMVVEDTLPGLQAAKAAGMKAFAIYDQDSLPFWDQIQALADASFEDHHQLSQQLFGELGINTGE